MNAGAIFLVGAGGIAAYFGLQMWNHDPMVVAGPVAQVQSQLATMTSTWPRRDGEGNGSVRPTGTGNNLVNVVMRYGEATPAITCRILLEPVDAESTKMVPDCGAPGPDPEGMAATRAQLSEAYIREHARSAMNGDSFDRDRVDAASQVAVAQNLGAMQSEALKMHDEMQGLQAQGDQ